MRGFPFERIYFVLVINKYEANGVIDFFGGNGCFGERFRSLQLESGTGREGERQLHAIWRKQCRGFGFARGQLGESLQRLCQRWRSISLKSLCASEGETGLLAVFESGAHAEVDESDLYYHSQHAELESGSGR